MDDNSIFSEDQIAAQIRELPSMDANHTVAALYFNGMNEIPGQSLTAFANLAKALDLPITSDYGHLTILRRRSDKDLRAAAIARLQWKAERGEIIPALVDSKPED